MNPNENNNKLNPYKIIKRDKNDFNVIITYRFIFIIENKRREIKDNRIFN
jgi:hypothetical protein